MFVKYSDLETPGEVRRPSPTEQKSRVPKIPGSETSVGGNERWSPVEVRRNGEREKPKPSLWRDDGILCW